MPALHDLSSRQNAQFKQLREIVADPRTRRLLQRAWVEGVRLCEAACTQAISRQISFDLVVREDISIPSVMGTLGITDHQAEQSIAQIYRLSRALFDEIAQVETSVGWGLVMAIAPAQAQPGDIVIVDRVQDPGNLGSLFRTAAAASIPQVWCLQGTTDPWSPKALRAAMGAHFALSIRDQLTEAALLSELTARGTPCFATANHPDAKLLYADSLPLKKPCAWIFGQEGDGVSETLIAKSILVRIPQSKEVESLNVSHAAAVCLFEMQRRRQYRG